MHPCNYLFFISDSLHYPPVRTRGPRTFPRLPKRFLEVPGCIPRVGMRVTPVFFDYAQASPGWHLLVAVRLQEHIALMRGREVAEQWWLQSLPQSRDVGPGLGTLAAKEVSHG